MNKEIKQKWLETLRSGKYRQGNGLLRNGDDGFCCLGVLWEIDGTGWKACGEYYEANDGSHEIALLPSLYAAEVGVPLREQFLLAEMNDGGDTFEQIAAHIEANL